MASKLLYLQDLRDHPRSTGGERAAALDVAESAILEFFRRGRKQGIVQGDGGRPEKFTLTDAGLAQLRVLEAEANPSPTPSLPTKVEEKFSELEQTVHDTVEDVKGLFGLVDRILQAKGTSPAEPDSVEEEMHAEIAGLEEQKQKLEQELAKRSAVIEFYATQIAVTGFRGRPEMLETRAKKLAAELDSETQQAVLRLLEVEKKLAEERNDFWGPDRESLRKFQGEIAELREKLGFSAETSKEGREEESGEGE